MLMLLFQSTYSLFDKQTLTNEINATDIVVRTSAAAIFGYFLSTNFSFQNNNKTTNTKTAAVSDFDINTQNNASSPIMFHDKEGVHLPETRVNS